MSKPNHEIVLEAVWELYNAEKVVTRETIAQLTPLDLVTISDRLSYLVDSGLVYRVQRGVYMPAHHHRPARIISKSVLPDGTVKIEIGDDHVLTLTPRENRMLAECMGGAIQQYIAIDNARQADQAVGELNAVIGKLTRENGVMRSKINKKRASDTAAAGE